MKKAVSLLTLILLTVYNTFSQEAAPEMATAMRESGKIYVVVGVMTIIFAGILIYLFVLDKKISRLEKETQHSAGNVQRSEGTVRGIEIIK